MERSTWVGEAAGKGNIKDEAEIWGQGDRAEGERSRGGLASGQEVRGQESPAGEPAFLKVLDSLRGTILQVKRPKKAGQP